MVIVKCQRFTITIFPGICMLGTSVRKSCYTDTTVSWFTLVLLYLSIYRLIGVNIVDINGNQFYMVLNILFILQHEPTISIAFFNYFLELEFGYFAE